MIGYKFPVRSLWIRIVISRLTDDFPDMEIEFPSKKPASAEHLGIFFQL